MITREWSKKRPASDRLSCHDPKNKWTHELDSLKRKVEEQRAQSKTWKQRQKRHSSSRDSYCRHSSKDQIITRYYSKARRCSHPLEVMLEIRTSKGVIINVIQDLLISLINIVSFSKKLFVIVISQLLMKSSLLHISLKHIISYPFLKKRLLSSTTLGSR